MWTENSPTGDSYISRTIELWSYANHSLDADGIAEVSDPWEPLADAVQFIYIYHYSYNNLTLDYTHSSANYQLDSFDGGTPPDTTPPSFTSLTPSTATL